MVRSPFLSDVLSLQNSLDRALSETLSGPFPSLWTRSNAGDAIAQSIPLDVYATDDHAMILAAVPGMRPDDLEVTVHQNTVSLSGTIGNVAEAEETRSATWYGPELSSGGFRRSITLPFQIDADHVEASFENGIVKVKAPKAEQAKPRRIAVTGGPSNQAEAISAGSTDHQSS